jgi:hypothetical protein
MTEDEFIKNLPAFPHEHRVGMTLRDYFAAKAMQGLVGSAEWREDISEPEDRCGLEPTEFTAKAAYIIADAMLKARGQE